MITNEELTSYILHTIPDAEVVVMDRTGTRDHFAVRVVSEAFAGKSLLDRQRLVYQALKEPMRDGRIHALEIKTATKAEA